MKGIDRDTLKSARRSSTFRAIRSVLCTTAVPPSRSRYHATSRGSPVLQRVAIVFATKQVAVVMRFVGGSITHPTFKAPN
jgi:hypothetical protein